ncbi:tetratricopeptide repeat protein [Halomonas aquatica]|uniref:Tetratricopeptide repeat protein n=1 Tax=Halomonas aquatica TaxID=3151123 RepID=A0ABV1NI77_9GAMM
MFKKFLTVVVFFAISTSSVFANSYDEGVDAYEAGDYKEAMEILLPFAEQGNAEAQVVIGTLHSSGMGVDKDKENAARWFRKAANKGNAVAILNLDLLYSRGEGGTSEEIFSWYLNLANSKESLDPSNPGSIYVTAQYNVGLFYLEGKGVERDPEEAINWLMEAEKNGSLSAKYVLAMEYYKGDILDKDARKAFDLFEVLASEGDARSQYFIGMFYLEGDVVPQNHSNASYWFKKSSEQGVPNAQYQLSSMYTQGLGVREDLVIAYFLSSLSAAQGHEGAKEIRDILFDYLSRDQVEEGQRLTAQWEVGTRLPSHEDTLTWP